MFKRKRLEGFLKEKRVSNYSEGDKNRLLIDGVYPNDFDHFFVHLGIPGISGWRSLRAIAENSKMVFEKMPMLRKNRAEADSSILEDERQMKILVDFISDYVKKCDELGFSNGIGKLSL